MRIAIYGLPSSGKSTLMRKITNARVVNGREELERLSKGAFASMSENARSQIRVRYTEYLSELQDEIIVSDGHYSFVDNIVFTPNDAAVYDVFFYLYCAPEELLRRYCVSEKNQYYSSLSLETIRQWQLFEIDSLREECHTRNKDFYVISDNDQTTAFFDFFELIRSGYSSIEHARRIATRISELYPLDENEGLCITDGDKTIIEQDTFRFCYDGKTNVFDGDFYTGFQSFLFSQELKDIISVPESVNNITISDDVWKRISDMPYVVISSGISIVWEKLKDILGLSEVIADPMISADVKFYVVKMLKEKGYRIIAFGDSKNDYYMLKEADNGYLRIGQRISRSLTSVDLSGIHLIYDKRPFFLTDEASPEDIQDISVCKSNSGINGHRLATAHLHLGQRIGRKIAEEFPSNNVAVLVLDRGGRFFGDGVYSSFGGVFYPYNPRIEAIPIIEQNRIVIVDSVINTGKSIIEIISKLKNNTEVRDIIVVSNVIQQEAIDLLEDYKVFVVRSSSNSFVGRRQAKQYGNTGPDTADRLFNLIDSNF